MRIISGVFAVILAVLVLTVTFGSWYTVDEGERGVVLRNGAMTGVAEAGLQFKTPWIEEVVKISTRQQTVRYEAVQAYSRDQQTATMAVSVTFAVPGAEVGELYQRFGSIENLQSRLIDRQINEQVEIVFGRFNAITAVQDRARLSAEISAAMKAIIQGPVLVTSIQVENIDFSNAYEKSIEERMTAEVKVDKRLQDLRTEQVDADIAITKARGIAESSLVAARAQAEATKLAGEAEAAAIKARGDALRENPELVALTQAERWDGVLPTTMIPGGAVPMLSVK